MDTEKSYKASGYAKSEQSNAFVSVSPAFPLNTKSGSCHVGATFFMRSADARHLAADLLTAADVADGKTVEA